MKPWMAWGTGILLLVGAWFVTVITPPADAAQAPFVVPATMGERVTSRTMSFTVNDARVASRAVAGPWSAEGTWLVIDLEAELTLEEGALLNGAVLRVGDREYRASERPESLFGSSLYVGIPRSGSIAFELPPDAATGSGVLVLSDDSVETRLDTVVELPLDLAGLPRVEETDLLPTGWARP